MYDLKSFKDHLRENFCHKYKIITNFWNIDDHESITRTFLLLKYCSLSEQSKWTGFFNFLIRSAVSGEWRKKLIWTSLLDKIALQYLESAGIEQKKLAFIQKRVEKERELNNFLNNKEEK
jgi:hypothetical protein